MKKRNNKTVEGKGFVITVPDIHHVRYSHGEFIAEVEIEGGSNDDGQTIDWLIYTSTLAAKNEADILFLSEHREEILDCISDALTLLGMPHVIA
jgi:hypothetical protein